MTELPTSNSKPATPVQVRLRGKALRSPGRPAGFTLVELLIVVIIFGVLAAVVVPQFTASTNDAKVNVLHTNLSELRRAVELYYHQHGGVYPGAKKHTDGSAVGTAKQAELAFVAQLTLYSSSNGVTRTARDETFKYGPYIKGGKLPKNPFNQLTTVLCDIAENDITKATASDKAAWKFYTITGRLIADDTDGVDAVVLEQDEKVLGPIFN